MTQYFSDVLQKPTSGLDVPDLQAIAKDHNVKATLIMCRLTIAIAVQCEKNKDIIEKIQGLSETDQHYLMKAIEQVGVYCGLNGGLFIEVYVGYVEDHGVWRTGYWGSQHDRVSCRPIHSLQNCAHVYIRYRDDHYYQIQSERSQILSEKETLNQVYQALLKEHRTLQTNFDDVVSEKEDALLRLREVQRDAHTQRNDKADIMMRAEIDRLRADL